MIGYRKRHVVALITCFIVVFSMAVSAQVLKGSISGTATDPEGAVIPGATVKATNVATGAVYNTTTDASGLFRFSLIPAGEYKVDISAANFNSAVQNGIQVIAGRDSGLGTVRLAVGQASTTVEVTATAPLIESTQSQVTNTFSGVQLSTFAGIQENQGLDNLALFVPGVSSSRDNNFSNFNGGTGFSSNGLRGRNNDQQIDGQNNNDNAATQVLVDNFKTKSLGGRSAKVMPIRPAFPAFGPSLFFVSELTAENHAPSLELNYQRDKKEGGK